MSFQTSMPFVCSHKPKHKVLHCGLCEKLWPIVSMQTHSPLMLEFSLPESLGRERGCLILLWQENQTPKLMDKSLLHAILSAVHQLMGKYTHPDVEVSHIKQSCFELHFWGSVGEQSYFPCSILWAYVNMYWYCAWRWAQTIWFMDILLLTVDHKTHWHSTHLSFSCFVHMCLLMAKCRLPACLPFSSFLSSGLFCSCDSLPPSQSTPLPLFYNFNCLSLVAPSLQK